MLHICIQDRYTSIHVFASFSDDGAVTICVLVEVMFSTTVLVLSVTLETSR